MIYAIEWGNIPKTSIYDKVYFHPNITVNDMKKIKHVKNMRIGELGLAFTVYTLLFKRYVFKSSIPVWKHRIGGRLPLMVSLFCSFGLTLATKLAVFDKSINYELKHLHLDKYLDLDLDLPMIAQDLNSWGIDIKLTNQIDI